MQFLEALARCGLHKYKDASFLAPGARAEGAALNLLGLADEEGVLNFGARSFKPARFDFLKVPRLEGENDARRALWRQLWPRIDLAMIDDFPAWERPVHDLLQGNLSALAAVFLGYAPMGEKDWLQLLRDACPGTEGLPGSAVFRAVVPAGRTLSFHRFLLALCLMAEHLANPHKRYQIEWAPVLTKGTAAAAAAAAAKADEVASEPKPKPAKKTLGTPTTAKSKPEALVEALDGFLQQNLLTPGNCKRSPVLTLHAEMLEDSALQVMIGDFKPQLQQLHDLAAAPVGMALFRRAALPSLALAVARADGEQAATQLFSLYLDAPTDDGAHALRRALESLPTTAVAAAARARHADEEAQIVRAATLFEQRADPANLDVLQRMLRQAERAKSKAAVASALLANGVEPSQLAGQVDEADLEASKQLRAHKQKALRHAATPAR
jgi:hypothetical protein